jgi:hypothetical protein
MKDKKYEITHILNYRKQLNYKKKMNMLQNI